MTHELFVLRGFLAALKALVIVLDADADMLAATLMAKAISVLADYTTELIGEPGESPTKVERLVEDEEYKKVTDYIAKLEAKLIPLALAMCESNEAREDIKNILRA